MRKTKYTADVLRPIVATSRSLAEVIRSLGLKPTGGNHRFIQSRIRQAGLDTSHFGERSRVRIAAVPLEQLEKLVRESSSFAAVLTKLGLPHHGRPHHELKRQLRLFELDTSHFSGRGWSRGFTTETHPSVAQYVRSRSYPDEIVFVENGPSIHGRSLMRRLVKQGVPYRCAICGISEWCARPLTLHLDHINGINNDNRRENLRLLCPNCHSQTPTYCRKAREEAACYTYARASVLKLVAKTALGAVGRKPVGVRVPPLAR